MKRHYRMHISVSLLSPGEVYLVLDSIAEEWARPERVRRVHVGSGLFLEVAAESHLALGESEARFAERMTVAIWKTLRRYVKVTIDAVYLEEPPSDSYEFGEFDYNRLVGAC